MLRNCETWETDGISSQLTLTMDGQSVDVELEQGDVYIDEKPDAALNIYIPHDESKQDESIQSTLLPNTLIQWIMSKPGAETAPSIDPRAIGIATGLLNAKHASLARILDKAGIIGVDIPNVDVQDDEVFGVASAPAGSHTPPRSPSDSSGSLVEVFTPGERDAGGARFGGETPLTDPFSVVTPGPGPPRALVPTGYFARAQPSPKPPRESGESRLLYRQLLDHVIRAGRSARFPSQGAFDMSPLHAALLGRPEATALAQSFSAARFSTFEIGAAGELFVSLCFLDPCLTAGEANHIPSQVFELLFRLNPALPGFSLGNWTSGIRTLANAHQDYESMASWPGRCETSDLEYEDADGVFTDLLVEEGYLPSEQWQGKTPKYHFEVKSTPQELEAPFFMSGPQYGKVRDFQLR